MARHLSAFAEYVKKLSYQDCGIFKDGDNSVPTDFLYIQSKMDKQKTSNILTNATVIRNSRSTGKERTFLRR